MIAAVYLFSPLSIKEGENKQSKKKRETLDKQIIQQFFVCEKESEAKWKLQFSKQFFTWTLET